MNAEDAEDAEGHGGGCSGGSRGGRNRGAGVEEGEGRERRGGGEEVVSPVDIYPGLDKGLDEGDQAKIYRIFEYLEE